MRKEQYLPTGCFQAKYWTELWMLTPRKKKFIPDNIIPRYGIQYFVWSAYTRHYYLRTLEEDSNLDDLKLIVSRGWVFLYLTDEQKSEIKADVEASGLSYYKLNLSRLLVWELWSHLEYADKGASGYQSRKQSIEKQLFEITVGANY
jgi:hypothetical protein